MKTQLKTILSTFIAFIVIGCVQSAEAQSGQNETALIQDMWGMEKQEIIEEYMDLNELEAKAFWPVYEEYAEKRKKIGAERMDIIMDYANNYENMSDKKAADITKNVFRNNMDLEKLQKKYYGKLSKVIAPVRATQFMQLEKYLDTTISSEMQDNIPFLKDLGETKGS